ncbi:hypothetical protein [Limimaricola soesokkakensis]|uniref:hypothetical protein n=1 Tax=Limimaricola soesokkakensis TaxID=1343159 RepID=UPI00351580AE
MERVFQHDGDTCRIEARLENDIWHVRAMRGEKQVGTAGRLPAAYRIDAEALGEGDPLHLLVALFERRMRSGEI